MEIVARLLRSGRQDPWVVGLAVVALLLTLLASTFQGADPHPEDPLARSRQIVHGAEDEFPRVLRILYYGQSITGDVWTEEATSQIQSAFPDTQIVDENLAIGGFSSQFLVWTTARDLKTFDPDLIVFNVYGDHRKYREILEMFSSMTDADVILQTYHSLDDNEECTAQWGLRGQGSCRGFLRLRPRDFNDWMSRDYIPSAAQKLGFAVHDQYQLWRDHLQTNDLPASALLRDNVHLNGRGNQLMADMLADYLIPELRTPPLQTQALQTQALATSVEVSNGAQGSSLHLRFEGGRLEVLSNGALPEGSQIWIDGQASVEHAACLLPSRTSPTHSMEDWPAISQVTLGPDAQPERWTLTIEDSTSPPYSFSLEGSETGPDGEGSSNQPFQSTSDQITIEPGAWNLARAAKRQDVAVPAGLQVQWDVVDTCGAVIASEEVLGTDGQWLLSLASGLSAGTHRVEISIPEGAEFEIFAARSFPK